MSKRKNGFTLVELLAVIVILAVILVIAVPQIMDTIKEARYGSIKSSVKLIADGVEKEYINRLMLGKDTSDITCDDVSKLGSDYNDCSIVFDSNGKATVTIVGQNKFEGITCTGNKSEVTCSENDNSIKNYPMMVESNTWYKSAILRANIETVEFVDTYTPTGNELDSWNVDVDDTGEIRAYIVGPDYTYDDLLATGAVDSADEKEVKVIIAGNGSGKISANFDSTYMFEGYYSANYNQFSELTKISGLNFLDTSKVTDMSYMFYGSKATTLDLSNFDTSNVTNMSYMFHGSAATTLDLSSLDTSNVTDMSEMFSYSEAKNLDLSNLDTSNVTNMSHMFESSAATSLNLSSWDTSNVTDMSGMFYSSSVTTLDLSSFDISNVTNMSYMFSGCSAINGYANSNEDVAKFNSSITQKPNILTFTLKTDSNFSEDSWATIVSKVKSGNHSYNVGNIKKIDLGSFGEHLIKISNITPCDGTLSSETACGFVLEFADVITWHAMNSDITNLGGWRDSEMRTYINNNIYNALPTELKAGIISTTVVSGYGKNDSSNFTTTDNMYLLSTKEVYGKDGISSDTANGDNITRQLDWYKLRGVTSSNYSSAIKKDGNSKSDWWLRSVDKSYMDSFNTVSTYKNGNLGRPQAHTSAGVSPAFRLSN